MVEMIPLKNNFIPLSKTLRVLPLLILITGQVFAQKVTASVDARSISINEVITYTIRVEGASDNPKVDISPVLKSFSLVSGPSTQSNMQFVNGKMTSSRSTTWTFIANRTGKLTIPTLTVKVGSRNYQSNSISIDVTDSPQESNSNNVFIIAEMEDGPFVIGEQVTVTYKMYMSVNLSSINDVNYPEFSGFWVEELFRPRQLDFRDAQLNGQRYKVATLYKVALFPTKTGEITLAPMMVNLNVEVKSRNRRRSIWDDPFFNSVDPFNTGRNSKQTIVRTNEKSLEILPYKETPPPGFTNAVGQFSIRTSLDQNEVKSNEAVTFTVELDGTGNIPLLTLPDIIFPADLEVFPPTTEIERDPFRDDITGKVRIEYILIPRNEGTYMLPRVDFPYYNPGSETWERSVASAKQLKVQKGESMINTGPGFTKEEIVLLGKDIRYIRMDTPKWKSDSTIASKWMIIMSYGVIAMVLLFPGITIRMQQKQQSTQNLRQSRGALKKAMKDLRKPQEDIFKQSAQTTYRYLKEKYSLETEHLDARYIESELKDQVEHETLEKLVSLIQVCDAGQYAPGASSKADSLLDNTKHILKEIDAQS